ncbi:alpha/beta hydrolase fold domain-containing protein [Chloroflexota bacterium]
MNKVAIICILVFTTILSSITSGCAEAIFEVANLTIDSQEVESGQSATVSVEIANNGGAEGSYPVILKIDGIQVDEKNVTVGPEATQQVTFTVTREESGSCNVDVNGLTAILRVLKPAEFKVESFVVSPNEVTEGGSCTVTVDVTNLGEVEGDYEATLRVNDEVQETKTVTIAAGDTEAVSFSLVKNQARTYNLSIGIESGTLTVKEPVVILPPPVIPTVVIPNTTVEVTKDVEYGRASDIPLLLDIHTPGTPIATPMPAIIFIHGGGWDSGDKSEKPCVIKFSHLATHGFFVASINYRLSGEAPFPAAVEDSKCAIRWLRANADKYNVDPQRIGVAGYSAGGHLAMMVGLVDETAGLEGNGGWGEFSSRVQAVCSYYGPSDFVSTYYEKGSRPSNIKFLGGTMEEKPEIYKTASPINYVTKDDPPLLLVHGELDETVSYNQSEEMYQAYQRAGLEAELIKVNYAGHIFKQLTDSPISPSLDEIQQARLDFFIKHLLLNR